MSLFKNFAPFKSEVLSYLDRCSQAMKETGDTAGSKSIDAFMKDFQALRYNLTLVGSLKRGKSTLLNTLMERKNDDISPVSLQVCTSAIIKYLDKSLAPQDDQKEKAMIYFDTRPEPMTIPLSSLREYVTERGNPGNEKKVRAVEVFGDFPEWSKAVTIVDSPGQNAIYGYHDALLTDFLPSADAIVFLIAADLPLDGGDLSLLKQLSEKDQKKIFFVLSKSDEIDSGDLDAVEAHAFSVISQVGLPCEKIYRTSAKPVFDALKKGITGIQLEELKKEHGILELERDLEAFILRESSQTKIFRSRIETILKETGKRCEIFVNRSKQKLASQNFDVSALTAENDSLKERNEDLRRETQKALKRFDGAWQRKLNSFSRKFAAKGPAIDNAIIDGLNKGGLIKAVFTSFNLKKQVQKAVTLEIQPLVCELEEQLQSVIESLNKEFDEAVTVYVKNPRSGDVVTPLSSQVASAAMVGTLNWSWATATTAFTTSVSLLEKWGTAAATAAATAGEANALPWYSCFRHLVWWSTQSDKIISAADAARNGATVASATILSGVVSAVVSLGVSIIVTLLVQKLLHIGLVKFQEGRVSSICEKLIEEMEDEIFKSLTAFKESVIADYEEKIEAMIADNEDQISSNEQFLQKHDPIAIEKLETQVSTVEKLMDQGSSLQARIPMLEE